MHGIEVNDVEFASFNFKNLKYRRGNQIIQLLCRSGDIQGIRSALFNLKKFWKTEKSTAKSSTMHENQMNEVEFASFTFSKLKCRRGDQIIQLLCRIGTPEWMHWNETNEVEFVSFKVLKLKYKRATK